jgi:nucleoside-diphosphate-sugar epimerase
MATYFITGVSGFVGSRFAADCARRGVRVKALVRDEVKAKEKLIAVGVTQDEMRNIQFVRGDLTFLTAEHYMQLKDCDAVFHAGAKVGFLGPRRDYLTTNYYASLALANMAKRAGVKRLVYLSSQAAVRPIKYRFWDTHESLSPATPYPSKWSMGLFHYGRAKQLAEKGLMNLSDASFVVTIFRPHVIWGVGDTTLANVLLAMSKKVPLTLVNGPHRCASSHVGTLIHYSHRALEIENGVSGVFHMLDGSNLTMNEWLDSYSGALGITKIKRISYHPAYLLAALVEGAGRFIRLFYPDYVPPLNRFEVDGMGRSMHGDMRPTIEAFGPQPQIDVNYEMQKFREWCRR